MLILSFNVLTILIHLLLGTKITMKYSLLKSALLATVLTTTGFGLVACNEDNDGSSITQPDTITNDQIQAKQGDQVDTFAAIKTLQSNLTDVAGLEAFNSQVASKLPSNAKPDLENWLNAAIANKDVMATEGVAGQLARTPKNDQARSIVVNENAAEYGQLVKKSLIGAYQINNAVKEAAKLQAVNPDNAAVLANVTAYLLGDYNELVKGKEKGVDEDPYAGNEFEKYLKVVSANENFKGIEGELYDSLIAAKDNLDNQDEFNKHIMAAIKTAQKTLAIRAVHYLNAGAELDTATEVGEFGDVVHSVSEGLGMYYSLQYAYNFDTNNPYYTESEVDSNLASIDFWDKADAKYKLNNIAQDISLKFGFDPSKA